MRGVYFFVDGEHVVPSYRKSLRRTALWSLVPYKYLQVGWAWVCLPVRFLCFVLRLDSTWVFGRCSAERSSYGTLNMFHARALAYRGYSVSYGIVVPRVLVR